MEDYERLVTDGRYEVDLSRFLSSPETAETLSEVLDHYNRTPATLISDELEPLNLDTIELQQIESFLHALEAPLSTPEDRLRAP